MPPDRQKSNMLYTHGPTQSGRLGRSLEVSIVPANACTYSCIYCQHDYPDKTRFRRESFYLQHSVLKEIISHPALRIIDTIVFTGEGEPSLSSDLGRFIKDTRQLTGKRIVVATNASLLYRIDVRSEIRNADVVIATLDAGSEEVFRAINRPHGKVRYDAMIYGLKEFRNDFSGQLWLEVMLIKDVNDMTSALQDISQKIKELDPDRLDITLPREDSVEPWVKAPTDDKLMEALFLFNSKLPERLARQREHWLSQITDAEEAICEIAAREPLQVSQARELMETYHATDVLPRLLMSGRMKLVGYKDCDYLLPSHTYFSASHCRTDG